MPGALAGLKVVDCTHVIAGSWCSLILADLGADVIKVETPEGEQTRGRPDSVFKPFDFVNRNKRAIALDVTKPEGSAVVRKMCESADIFVENYRPGAMARSGLGYEDVRKVKPDIIYCSISGFGQTGPYRDRGGFDLIAQGMSGIMSFTGDIGSEKPIATGVPVGDLNAGTFAALAVLAALQHRARTGEGQHVETSLLEAALAYTVWEAGKNLTTGEIARPAGSRHRLAAPYEAFRTKDGHIVTGVNSQRLWGKFCRAIGMPELENDPRFSKKYTRLDNREELQVIVEKLLATDTTANWMTKFLAEGVPCGPVNTIQQALRDPQVEARGMIVNVDGARYPRTPIVMNGSPVEIRRKAPRIGQHTREVLTAEGLSADEIETLKSIGAIRIEGEEA